MSCSGRKRSGCFRARTPAKQTLGSAERFGSFRPKPDLGRGFRTLTADWPGFGDGRQAWLDYRPALLLDFLEAFVEVTSGTEAPAVLAAGHVAGYALALAARRPGIWRKLAFVAPSWRGPLRTMMGGYKPLQRRLRAVGYLPAVGPLLYRLNVSEPVNEAHAQAPRSYDRAQKPS